MTRFHNKIEIFKTILLQCENFCFLGGSCRKRGKPHFVCMYFWVFLNITPPQGCTGNQQILWVVGGAVDHPSPFWWGGGGPTSPLLPIFPGAPIFRSKFSFDTFGAEGIFPWVMIWWVGGRASHQIFPCSPSPPKSTLGLLFRLVAENPKNGGLIWIQFWDSW